MSGLEPESALLALLLGQYKKLNLKVINILLNFVIFIIGISITLLIIYFHNIPSPIFCDGSTDNSMETLFFYIREVRENVWHVLFKNVRIEYEVMMCTLDTDTTTSRFEYRQIGPNYPGLFRPECIETMTREEKIEFILKNNQSYEIHENGYMRLTGSLDPNLVFTASEHNNVVDATIAHFNSIQRGDFHPNVINVINPNPHGKSVDVLSSVPNRFGGNDINIWPAESSTMATGAESSRRASVTESIASAESSRRASVTESSKKAWAESLKNSGRSNKHEASEHRKHNNSSHSHSHSDKGKNKANDYSDSDSDGEADRPAEPKGGRGIRSPLEQFSIINWLSLVSPLLANVSFTYTNMDFYLTIITLIIVSMSALAINYEKIVANTWSSGQESIYATVYNIVVNQINTLKGQYFYPFIYCLFVFILTSNLVGMIPYNFAPTSHFALTFFISFTVVIGSTFLGFALHKLGFFSLFVPTGCPLGLLPLLVLIEFISYIARNVSLGLRLAANVLSGHMLLNILGEFTYKIMETNFGYLLLSIIPLIFIGAFSCLEFGIGFIQAQVFCVLSSSYIKDGLLLH